jgi:SAM-dependent methyltransferase
MADLMQNKKVWDEIYDWEQESGKWGEEWSIPWGGSYVQWICTLYPRISKFIPTNKILEIAPGYGRWAQFLIPLSTEYIGVDLATKCVENCRIRFNQYKQASFFLNDGMSLAMVPDDTIDFCFSFDSLVHAETDVIEQYLIQIIKKLKKNGAAFIHHSNFEEYNRAKVENKHWRAWSINSEKVSKIIHNNFGKVILQEKTNWLESDEHLIDGITVFCRQDSDKYYSVEAQVINNCNFNDEATYCKKIFYYYAYLSLQENSNFKKGMKSNENGAFKHV